MRDFLKKAAGAALLMSGFGIALSASSCTNPATEIVAGFSTQMQVPKDLRSVVVVITQGGRPIRCTVHSVVDGTVRLPGTIGAVPAPDRDGVPPEPVNVSVLGFRFDLPKSFESQCFLGKLPDARPEGMEDEDVTDVVVVRRAALQYTEDRILYTPMPLKESCRDVGCEDDKTCIGGLCVDKTVDVTALPDYRDDLIFGDANTCFNVGLCLEGRTLAVLEDKDTCTYKLPVPEDLVADTPRLPGQLNVEVIYTTSLGTEVLDLSDQDGFVFPDESDPWTFRLADNLCTSQFKIDNNGNIEFREAPKIQAVYASPLCIAKRPLQPICTADLDDIQSGARSPALAALADVCPFGDPLQSTESVLYVLMDRSASMSEFYGEGGLEFAVGVSLENPVAARTQLGFSFFPAADTDCDEGTAFATPTFPGDAMNPFGEPDDDLRKAIGNALNDNNTLLPGAPADDPMTYLDAAMRGAYAGLHGVAPTLSATFNRKALVIIGNRDFQRHCMNNMELNTLAENERTDAADPIFTYVAVLDGPDDAPNFGANAPNAAGAAIAVGGGTQVIDAVNNPDEGALAVQNVLNELGSCIYDPITPPGDATLDDVATLSFINPLTQEPTIIERDDSCTATDVNVDGFGFDTANGNRVIICGAPCQTLRDALIDSAKYHAANMLTAPQVPVLPGLTCTRRAEILNALYSDLYQQ